jgi:hypothetical protein
MENGMLIGNNGKKSLPDTLPNLYHGKKDAYAGEKAVVFNKNICYNCKNIPKGKNEGIES